MARKRRRLELLLVNPAQAAEQTLVIGDPVVNAHVKLMDVASCGAGREVVPARTFARRREVLVLRGVLADQIRRNRVEPRLGKHVVREWVAKDCSIHFPLRVAVEDLTARDAPAHNILPQHVARSNERREITAGHARGWNGQCAGQAAITDQCPLVVGKPECAVLGNRTSNCRAVLVLLIRPPGLVVLVQFPRVRIELVILRGLEQRAVDFVGLGFDGPVDHTALGCDGSLARFRDFANPKREVGLDTVRRLYGHTDLDRPLEVLRCAGNQLDAQLRLMTTQKVGGSSRAAGTSRVYMAPVDARGGRLLRTSGPRSDGEQGRPSHCPGLGTMGDGATVQSLVGEIPCSSRHHRGWRNYVLTPGARRLR